MAYHLLSNEFETGRMKSISIYYRKGAVFIVPQRGITDVGPVFTAGLNRGEIAAALQKAIAVNPAEQVLPAAAVDYRSPILRAMNIKSNVAFERG